MSGTLVGVSFVLIHFGTRLLDCRQASVSSKKDEGEAVTKRSSLGSKFKCDQGWSDSEQDHASPSN